MPAKPATVLGSELHTIKSKHTNKPYRIAIGLPNEYYDKPNKNGRLFIWLMAIGTLAWSPT